MPDGVTVRSSPKATQSCSAPVCIVWPRPVPDKSRKWRTADCSRTLTRASACPSHRDCVTTEETRRIPLIAPRHLDVPLRLLGTRKYPDGVVRLRYAVQRGKA